MHPLDLIKTRFQLQTSAGAGGQEHYTGVLSLTITKLFRLMS